MPQWCNRHHTSLYSLRCKYQPSPSMGKVAVPIVNGSAFYAES